MRRGSIAACLLFLFGCAAAGTAGAYRLGGVACAAAPSNFGFYCFDGAGLASYRAAVADSANFGPGGVVGTSVSASSLAAFGAADLQAVDGLVVPWWSDAEGAPHVAAIVARFLAGGDLFVLADDPAHDPVNEALGVPTLFGGGSATAKPTTGNAPLHAGPFGNGLIASQFLATGRLDPATVLLRNGRIVGSDAQGQVTAAVWDRGDYAPGAGRLVIVTDVDMAVPPTASYAPANDNGRFTLNATAFLVQGGTIDPFAYDLVGVPSCAITPGGFGFYCGTAGALAQLDAALTDPANFGPGGVVARRAALVSFDAFTPALAARLRAVIVPWIEDGNEASYGPALRDWYLAGGNLWLLQDDPVHDPVGASLGIPTPTATGVAERPTNGTAPAYVGPFGTATDVGQMLAVGALAPADVAGTGGTVVGTAEGGTVPVVAAWERSAYAPGAGRMVIATDVDMLVFSAHASPDDNRRWALNVAAFLLEDADASPPVVTCAATPEALWPPNGRKVAVTVAGTIVDTGTGVDPTSASFSVADEYGQPPSGGTIAVGPSGTFAFDVPLVAFRQGGDRDGRRYAVTVTATDRAGNVGSCTVAVVVPHDRRP